MSHVVCVVNERSDWPGHYASLVFGPFDSEESGRDWLLRYQQAHPGRGNDAPEGRFPSLGLYPLTDPPRLDEHTTEVPS